MIAIFETAQITRFVENVYVDEKIYCEIKNAAEVKKNRQNILMNVISLCDYMLTINLCIDESMHSFLVEPTD